MKENVKRKEKRKIQFFFKYEVQWKTKEIQSSQFIVTIDTIDDDIQNLIQKNLIKIRRKNYCKNSSSLKKKFDSDFCSLFCFVYA